MNKKGRRSVMELRTQVVESDDESSSEDSLDEYDQRELSMMLATSQLAKSNRLDAQRSIVRLEGFLSSNLFQRPRSSVQPQNSTDS